MMSGMFSNRLNNLHNRRSISIEKEMDRILFVRRTLSVKALRARCWDRYHISIDMNALWAKYKVYKCNFCP